MSSPFFFRRHSVLPGFGLVSASNKIDGPMITLDDGRLGITQRDHHHHLGDRSGRDQVR
jgi:hypothetical protein